MRKKTRWRWVAVVLSAASLGAASLVWAAPRGMGHGTGSCFGPWGMGGGAGDYGPMIGWLAGRLDLTDDQKAEIEKMRDADREKVVSLRKELMRAHHDLRGEMMKDDPDAAKARKLTEKIGELRTDMQLLHLEHRLAVRRILTPEQQDRLILMGQRRGGFREGPGCRMEPPGDDDGPGPIRGGRFGGRGPRWSDEEED